MPTHKINADLALTGTLTVGVDDTGHDVIFYGATSGKYLHWDESADALKFRDSTYLYLGAGNDLQLYHNGTNNFIETYAGTLFITQHANDSDIILRSDDGSGGVTAYLTLDGGAGFTIADKKIRYKDNVEAAFGSSDDMMLKHDGTDGFIQNYTGDLYIRNNTNDKDIILQSDDGSGGTTTYLRIDGGDEIMKAGKNLRFNDNVKGTFGTSDDLQIYHDGTNSYIHNNTGALRIEADQDDGDIEFRADNNSGGLETYMFLDGGNNNIKFQKDTNFIDNVEAIFGTGSDLKIKHNGTNTLIRNFTGDLTIRNANTDNDVILECDDGSGGTTAYVTLDGSTTKTVFNKPSQRTFAVSSTTDGDANGDIVFLGGTTSMTAGKIYHYKANGTWELADADSAVNCDGLLAVALGSASDTDGMLLRGMVTLDHDPGNLADVLFLSTTAGTATNTAPSGSGDIVRVIGYLLGGSNGQIYFNPDGTFVEVS